MSYIVQRNQSFYVVAYNGRDPITVAERRRWHPAGVSRSDAEKIQRRINKQTLPGCANAPWPASCPPLDRDQNDPDARDAEPVPMDD